MLADDILLKTQPPVDLRVYPRRFRETACERPAEYCRMDDETRVLDGAGHTVPATAGRKGHEETPRMQIAGNTLPSRRIKRDASCIPFFVHET